MKSSLGNGELIRFPGGWQGPQPPATSPEGSKSQWFAYMEAVRKVRERGVAAFQALLTVLQRAKGIRASKLADLPLNSAAREEFNMVVDTLQQGDNAWTGKRYDVALAYYVEALDLICNVRCAYEKRPKEAFE